MPFIVHLIANKIRTGNNFEAAGFPIHQVNQSVVV